MRVEARGDTTSLADRKHAAGQHLLLRWGAPEVTDDLRRVVREIRPAGFVVEAVNCLVAEQLHELTRELADLADPHDPALISTALVRPVPESSTWPEHPAPWGDHPEASEGVLKELRALGLDVWLAGPHDAHVESLVTLGQDRHVAVVPAPLPAASREGWLPEAIESFIQRDPPVLRLGSDLTGAERAIRHHHPYAGPVLVDYADLPARLVDALKATIDLILAPPEPQAQLALFADLVRLQERDRGAERACRASRPRLLGLREQLFLNASPRPPRSTVGDPSHRVFAKIVSERYRDS